MKYRNGRLAEEIRKIVNIMIKDVFQSLEDKHIKGSMSKAAGDRLAEIGYDEKYGARPLRKSIRTNVEDPLSDMFLTGALKDVVSLKRIGPSGLANTAVGYLVFRDNTAVISDAPALGMKGGVYLFQSGLALVHTFVLL